MIVAMAIVRVVKVAVDQIAGVVAVGNGFVAATRSVHVIGAATLVIGGTALRIGGRNFNAVVLHSAAAGMMEVAVGKIVHVIAVLHSRVAAIAAVLVVVMIAIMSHDDVPPDDFLGRGPKPT